MADPRAMATEAFPHAGAAPSWLGPLAQAAPATPSNPAGLALLSTLAPRWTQQRHAIAVAAVALGIFAATAPFARWQLAPVPAFLPAYQTAVILCDLITCVLLLGQYGLLRSRALLLIACGYLFNTAMAALHALSFPGLFAPGGLLGAGPQTTAWLYFLWHGGFPLFIISAALSRDAAATAASRRSPMAWVVAGALAAALGLAALCWWLATRGSGLLPTLMAGDRDAGAKVYVASAVWALSLAALVLLWRRRPRALLDTWLMVIMGVWVFEVALAAVLNHARYDFGWYVGRVFGLLAAAAVLVALLLENSRLYGQLACASALEHAYLSHLPDPVVATDDQGRIWKANEALAHVLGHSIDELRGRRLADLMPDALGERDDAPLTCYVGSTVQGCTGRPREIAGRHKNGEMVPLEVTLSAFSHDGRRFFVAAFRDLRERRRLIAELTSARADAEQANRAKSAFLATMSHEIRTPMNGVLGMIEVLAHGRLTEHQRDLVGTIRESAFTLLTLIDDILDFSKIEAGRMEFERGPVSISDLVEGLASSLAALAAAKGVDLDLFVAPEVPEHVLSDDVRLRQVIYNLVGNAIKFSAGRPGLRGHVGMRVEVERAEPLKVAFSIADNGVGIPAHALQRLFTPFSQADASTARMFGGTGLGLAICHRLVTLMGGRIDVASAPGRGCTFTVRLPFEVPPQQQPRERPGLAGIRCVLVEGCPPATADLRAYLAHAGANVQAVDTLAAAARAAAAGPAPVVVLQSCSHEDGSVPRLHAVFAESPEARHLLLMRGRRRRARWHADKVVVLDADALRRDALLRAVAMAAGRALPEAEPAPPALPVPDATAPADQGPRILVADDDALNQKVILQQLAVLGHAAEVAGDGEEALRLWRSGRYALLLSDLHMPVMDGYALAARIRHEEGSGRRTPIVALTANALRGESHRARTAGVDEYLTKPISLDKLQCALARWLPAVSEAAPAPAPAPAPAAAAASASAPASAHAAAHAAAHASAPQPAAPGLPPEPVDLHVLKSIVGEDAAVLHEFLANFRAVAAAAVQELGALGARADLARIGDLAHRLKSSARAVGALALGDVYAALESAAHAANTDALARCSLQVEAASAAVDARIATLLAEACTPDMNEWRTREADAHR